MKLLLLAGIPPSDVDGGSLIIERLCRFLPPGTLACFAAVPTYCQDRAVVPAELDWMPLHTEPDPGRGYMGVRARLYAPALAQAAAARASRLVEKAVEFGRTFGADAVWCPIAGETVARMALPVATRLKVPLFTQILDPPELWFRFEQIDPYSRRRLANRFAKTLRESAALAAVSDPMREEYGRGTRSVTVLPSLDADLARPPADRTHCDDELVIGIAGGLHLRLAWDALLAALEEVNWIIDGRKVRIRLLGQTAPVSTFGPAHIEFLGWWPQAETVRLLSEADVLYCPGWFGEEWADTARLSFQSKLPAYFAAGRPVVFHGPPYSAAVRFLREHEAALSWQTLNGAELVAALALLASNRELYAKLAENGRRAFDARLTTEAMRLTFADFLGVAPDVLRPARTSA